MTTRAVHRYKDSEANFDDQVQVDLEAAERLADGIRGSWKDWIRRRKKISPQRNFRASSLGHPCDRKVILDITNWQDKPPVSDGLQQLFERGNTHEGFILRTLADLGYRILGEQQGEYDPDLDISCHIEGHIVEDRSGRPLMAEAKSSAHFGLVRCETLEQLRKVELGEKYYVQFQTGLYLTRLYAGVLLVWDVIDWEPVPIPIPFDLDFYDRQIQRIQGLNEHRRNGTLPEFHSDPRICRRCEHYGRACVPPHNFGEGALVLNDPKILEMMEEAEALEKVGRRWDQIVKKIRERVKPMGERIIIGDWLISNDGTPRTEYRIPPEIKAKFKTTETAVRTKWKRLPDRKETSSHDGKLD